MGRASNSFETLLEQFIQNLSDDDLVAVPARPGTIFKDRNFRLDNQGVAIHDQIACSVR